ncbi:hypothetical protein HCH_06373 [Hahella chejuensis KCTC 2396]|uniref:Uncharacterized protein n=1 Tax=Hahella chejuensis (strain KCTC 2396) TaxID=349521 RepID=Q2S8K5_HAHCH|nr:hypothetical protein [Hahella chejuensis]ABC33019.1 hypothetical protein HCH_06373 [Hahella chejuensis KCTC 2396]
MKKSVAALSICAALSLVMSPAMAENTQNPCKDSVYVSLKNKSLEQMTDREYETYKQADQACASYTTNVAAMQESTSFKNNWWWVALAALPLLFLL